MNPQIVDQPLIPSPPGSTAADFSDRRVIDEVLKGDTHLFELLMRRYNRRMFRMARSIVKDKAEAEDVLQEAYIQAYLNLKSFRGDGSAAGWLARIAINEALGRLRRRRNADLTERLDDFENFGSTMHGPEQFTRTHEALWLIESAIDALPRNYRMVFMLRAVEQLSIGETAEHLNIKPATVKTRLHRAKAILQNRLGRRLDELTVDVFPFGGRQCDLIVARLYAVFRGMKILPVGI